MHFWTACKLAIMLLFSPKNCVEMGFHSSAIEDNSPMRMALCGTYKYLFFSDMKYYCAVRWVMKSTRGTMPQEILNIEHVAEPNTLLDS